MMIAGETAPGIPIAKRDALGGVGVVISLPPPPTLPNTANRVCFNDLASSGLRCGKLAPREEGYSVANRPDRTLES